MKHDCDVEKLKIQGSRQWAVLQVGDAKRSWKDQSMEPDCDVEKLKSKVVANARVRTKESWAKEVEAFLEQKQLQKSSNFDQKLQQIEPSGTPKEAKNRISSQDGPRCFQE